MQLLFFCVFCIFETSSCLSWTQIIPLSTHSHLNECHQKQIYTESHSMPPLTALRHPPAVRSPATLPTAIVASRKTKPVRKNKKNKSIHVNPYFPAPWWLICHFFSGKVLYCMINRAYTCKSVCKCACVCAPCSIDTWGLIYAVLRRRYLKVQSIQICPTNPFRK